MRRKLAYSIIGIMSGAALTSTAAYAQEVNDPSTAGTPVIASDAPDAATMPGDIVVTAQKREQRLQDVPISMEVISSQSLATFHADSFKALSVPNMNVGEVGGNQVIYMRGFGSPSQNYAFDQSVSLYVDGIYAGKSRQFTFPFFDQERVEVLRGPQGALFGKNTAAGAISLISAQPTSTFKGSATGIYNFGLRGYELSGFVSGPLTEGLSARLALKVVDNDGYMTNRALDRREPATKSQLARLSLKYESDSFDYFAKLEYGHAKTQGSLTVSGPLSAPQDPVLTRFDVNDSIFGPVGSTNTSWNVAGTGNIYIGDYTLTSITGYSYFKANRINSFDQAIPGGGATTASVYNSYPERFDQFSQEIRLQSPIGGKFDYIIGAYYDSSDYVVDQKNEYRLAFGDFLLHSNFKQRAESYSVFGQGTFHATDELRFIGSMRYSSTSKNGSFVGVQDEGPIPFRPSSSAMGDINEGRVDPSGTVQFNVSRDLMIYGSYGQGSKSGGFVSNTYGTTDSTFKFRPERSRNIELGVKSTLFGGKLVANAAIYRIKFDNLQVSTYNSNVQTYLVGNAAKASGRGIEGSLAWYPASSLEITATGAYQDVKYDDYPGAQCLASQPVTECNPLNPASVVANNLAGRPLSNISKLSGNIRINHTADLNEGYRIRTAVMADGRSKFFNSDDQSTLYGLQKGYVKLDARIELSSEKHGWLLALVGKNLTNKITTSGSFRLPAPVTLVPRALYWVDQPRTISVEATVKF